MRSVFLAFIFILILQPEQAPAQVTTRYLAWGTFFGTVNFSGHWTATLDLQARYEYTDGDWNALIVRPGVSYVTTNKVIFTAGVGYFSLYPNPNGIPPRPEWRPWQEIGKKFKVKAGTFYPRLRIEQRLIREYNGDELHEDYSFHSFRARFRCDWNFPLGKTPSKGIYLAAGDELFFALKNGCFSAFDQNRAYAGAGYRFSPAFAVQLQYLNLYLQTNSQKAELQHIVRGGLTWEWNLKHEDAK